jgi:hypothetical protein
MPFADLITNAAAAAAIIDASIDASPVVAGWCRRLRGKLRSRRRYQGRHAKPRGVRGD